MIKNIMILLLPVSLLVSGCKDLPHFPTKYIFEYIPSTQECYQYEVVSQDPLKVSDGVLVTVDQCQPSIIGFDTDNAAEVFDYIRELQSMAKKRCK